MPFKRHVTEMVSLGSENTGRPHDACPELCTYSVVECENSTSNGVSGKIDVALRSKKDVVSASQRDSGLQLTSFWLCYKV